MSALSRSTQTSVTLCSAGSKYCAQPRTGVIAVPETSLCWESIQTLDLEKQTLTQYEWLFSGDGSCVINDHVELRLRQRDEARNQDLERRWQAWAAARVNNGNNFNGNNGNVGRGSSSATATGEEQVSGTVARAMAWFVGK